MLKILMKFNRIKYGKNLIANGFPIIFRQKGSQIIIGDNFTVNSSFLSNLVGLFQRTIIVTRDKGNIIIGDSVGVSGVTIYSRKSIVIGSYTNIGGNTKILDNDFHPIDPELRKKNDLASIKDKEIIIGENVFIGCNCIILKGTEIGDNCVIGAGSVVSGKYGDNLILAGNPAKIIKKLEVNEKC